MCIIFTRLQLLELCNVGLKTYIGDVWNLFEVLYVFFQLSVNVLFLTYQYIPNAVWRENVVEKANLTDLARLALDTQRRQLSDYGDHDVLSFGHMRVLKGAGGGPLKLEGGLVWMDGEGQHVAP